jgi:hypothetical protein
MDMDAFLIPSAKASVAPSILIDETACIILVPTTNTLLLADKFALMGIVKFTPSDDVIEIETLILVPSSGV